MRITSLLAASLCLLSIPAPRAAVTAAGAAGFETRNEAVIAAPPDKVYMALLRVGRWWDPEHTYSGEARNLRLDPRPGGCFCEKIPGKGAIEHMRVIYVAKNEVLRMAGALGPLQESGLSGTLTWNLKTEAQGTRLVQDYRVGGYRPDGFEELAPLVGQVLEIQLSRLKQFVETGEPVGNDR
jgi:uncharacterized protein YndB with AHSA1/START domain